MIQPNSFFAAFSLAVFIALAAGQPAGAQSVEKDEAELLEAVEQPVPEENVDESRAAELIVQRTNEVRESEGLAKFEVNANLKDAAQYFAQYMARTDKYGPRSTATSCATLRRTSPTSTNRSALAPRSLRGN
ncbi:MAG: CAP domain-containing protein [Pirellulales bacterium]